MNWVKNASCGSSTDLMMLSDYKAKSGGNITDNITLQPHSQDYLIMKKRHFGQAEQVLNLPHLNYLIIIADPRGV